MGVPILVLGRSGSGKSTSLRGFEPDEVVVLNVAGKPLPFKKRLTRVNRPNYAQISRVLKSGAANCYVIDDANYLMAFESFDKADETGFGKFTKMAVNFKKMLDAAATTDDDTTVYIMMHVDTDESGFVHAKTIGKMLDNQLCIEGLFPIVLMAVRTEAGYEFETRTNGFNTVKTPDGMFDEERIPNDLQMVDDAVREYWGMAPRKKSDIKKKESKNA